MKCVPIRPLVVAPQMAKPATSAQKVRTRAARPSTWRVRRAGLTALRTGGVGTASAGEPYGVMFSSDGELRRKIATIGTTARAIAAMMSDAVRQDWVLATSATIGRKIS